MTDTSETPFVRGFIEAVLFTERCDYYEKSDWFTDGAREDRERGATGNLPVDVEYGDIHPDSLARIREFCRQKQDAMAGLLARAYARGYSETQAGSDLWFTYCGFGVDFNDRAVLQAGALDKRLSEACSRGDPQVWFGDHVKHGNAPFVHFEVS